MLKTSFFIDIWFVKQDIPKWLKTKISVFYGEFENEQKKEKKIDLPERGMKPRFSVIFPPMVWIFMEGEGDEIKSKQASKRGRTLPFTLKWLWLDGRTSLIVSYHYTSSSTLFFNNPQCAMKTHCDTFYDSFFLFLL